MGKNTKVNKHIEIMKPLQKYVFSMYSKCVCVCSKVKIHSTKYKWLKEVGTKDNTSETENPLGRESFLKLIECWKAFEILTCFISLIFFHFIFGLFYNLIYDIFNCNFC